MQAALVVPRISADAVANVARMVDQVDRAAEVAFAVGRDGELCAALPVGVDSTLVVDIGPL